MIPSIKGSRLQPDRPENSNIFVLKNNKKYFFFEQKYIKLEFQSIFLYNLFSIYRYGSLIFKFFHKLFRPTLEKKYGRQMIAKVETYRPIWTEVLIILVHGVRYTG